MCESHERRQASMRVHGGLRLASTGVTWTTPDSFHGRMAFPCRWIQWPARHTIATYFGSANCDEKYSDGYLSIEEKGDLECHRGRLKDKYSAHRGHLTLRASLQDAGISILKRFAKLVTIESIPWTLSVLTSSESLLLLSSPLLNYFFSLSLSFFFFLFFFLFTLSLSLFPFYSSQRAFWTYPSKVRYPLLWRYHFPIKVKSYVP